YQSLRKNRKLHPKRNFCDPSPITLSINDMKIPNTGSDSSIPTQYVDEYIWTLPDGWRTLYGETGTIRYESPIITIYPDDGCRQGTASVQGFIGCSLSTSNSVSFELTREKPTLAMSPQAGYTGPACNSTTPVTFTATEVSCASNYVWSFPAGWRWINPSNPNDIKYSPVTINGNNSIRLTPGGGQDDAGTVAVKINLDCGTQLSASSYELKFQDV